MLLSSIKKRAESRLFLSKGKVLAGLGEQAFGVHRGQPAPGLIVGKLQQSQQFVGTFAPDSRRIATGGRSLSVASTLSEASRPMSAR